MPSYNIQDGNEGFKRFKTVGEGTDENPYVPVVGINVVPDVDSTTGWTSPLSDTNVVSEKLIKETIDNQEITAASFNTADGVLTLTKTDGNITVDLDGRYLTTITSIDADVVTVSNLEIDNFKSSAIVTEAEGITNNDNDTTIPTSAAVKDYVDNSGTGSNTYVTSASFNTGDGVLTLTLNDASTVTVDLDGRFLQNVIEDTTPQLGGNLYLNSNDITGTGNIDITGEVIATTLIGNMRGATIFKAKAGEALTKGDPVYISGDDLVGNQPVVSIADADDANKMPCFGLAAETVSINASVNVVTFGTLSGLDTSSFNQGDILYISTTGTLTATKPSGESSLIQNIGKVMRSHASAGSIKVGGAGRTNDVPNLNDGNVFIGNASNQAETRGLTLDDIAETATNKHFTASDNTKLDGIEDNATADQTAAEIKTAYESNADTNAYTDAEKTKLSGIATGAEVNVNADWNAVGGDAQILNKPTTITSAEQTKLGHITVTQAVDLDTMESKLNGVESGAIDAKNSFTQNDNQYIATDTVKARDNSGLTLTESGGNGVFIEHSTGNVGVKTTSPSAPLDVNGALLAGGGSAGPSLSYQNQAQGISFSGLNANVHSTLAMASNLYIDSSNALKTANTHSTMSGAAIVIPGSGATNQNALEFYTNAVGSVTAGGAYGGSLRMIIKPNGTVELYGDVGIGENPADAKLQVRGVSGTDLLRVRKTSGDTSLRVFENGNMSINYDGNDARFHIMGVNGETVNLFRIEKFYGGGDAFTVKYDGKVGIGTYSPTQALDVNGNAVISGTLSVGNITGTLNADTTTITNLEVDNLKSGVLDTDLASVSASDDTIPSAKATKAYADSLPGATNLSLSSGDLSVFTSANNKIELTANTAGNSESLEVKGDPTDGALVGVNTNFNNRPMSMCTKNGSSLYGVDYAIAAILNDTTDNASGAFGCYGIYFGSDYQNGHGWIQTGKTDSTNTGTNGNQFNLYLQPQAGNVGIGTTSASAKLTVNGSVSKTSGSFDIPHPDPAKKDTHRLRHYFVETPSAGGNIYKYQLECKQGDNYIDLPDYFEHLNENSLVWANPFKHFGRAWGEVIEGGKRAKIVVEQSGIYNILIFGDRKDAMAMQEFDKFGIEYKIKEQKK